MLRSVAFQFQPCILARVSYTADFEYSYVEQRSVGMDRNSGHSLSSLLKLVCGILKSVCKGTTPFAERVHNSAILLLIARLVVESMPSPRVKSLHKRAEATKGGKRLNVVLVSVIT
jgi:hypothetical protein